MDKLDYLEAEAVLAPRAQTRVHLFRENGDYSMVTWILWGLVVVDIGIRRAAKL